MTEDTISRQAAVEGSKELFALGGCYCDEYAIVGMLNSLPSAQSERKTGKWIVYYECPKCGEITKDFTEYCPFCNADMRGAEDD